MAEKIDLFDKRIEPHRPSKLDLTQKKYHWFQCKFWGSNVPVRSYSSATVLGSKLYVYGGQQMLQGVLDDFYSMQLNIGDKKGYDWVNQKKQNGPGKRARHTVIAYGDCLYLHGGITSGFKTQQSIFKYHTVQKKWQKLQNKGAPALDSHNAVLVKDPQPIIFYFMGFDGNQADFSNAIYSYHINSNSWKTIRQNSKEGPVPRASSAVSYDGSNFYLFGGKDDSKRMNDFWKCSPKDFKWEQIKVSQSNKPLCRCGHSLNFYNGNLILFGGIHDITWQLDDLQKFNIKENQWQQVQINSGRRNDSEASPKNKHFQSSSSPMGKTQKLSPTRKRATFLHEPGQHPDSGVKMLDEQRRKKFLQRKAQLLKNFQIDQKQSQKLISIQPISQAMKDSLELIGVHGPPPHAISKSPTRKQQLAKTTTSKFMEPLANQFSEVSGKRPCARDGHSCDIWSDWLIIFGGDRHQMSFDDIHKLSLKDID